MSGHKGHDADDRQMPSGEDAKPPANTVAGYPATAASPWNMEAVGEDREPSEMLRIDIAGFEGPLDLLLALARTQKVDLTKISVLALAEQYLAFIAEAQKVRLELAADFLVMAAWLAFLKSRLLLPREDKLEHESSAEDMALRLHFRLQRLAAMRESAARLFTRSRLGRDVFSRGMPEGARTIRERQYTADIYDLMKAYADQRKRTTVKRAHVIKRRVVWSIKDARQRLERLVGAELAGSWVQLDLFLDDFLPTPEASRTALASSLVASLEMARDGLIEIRQEAMFAPIFMRGRDPGAAGGKAS